MTENACIDMPALGRPFSLGTLYDARSDSLISGLTLWRPATLTTDLLIVPKPSTSFQIFTSNTVFDKLHSLKLNGDLNCSILGGLIDLGGSAKFLKETKCSAESARVTLRYSRTSQIEHMTMSQLGKIDYPDLDFRMATHVVSAVTYGNEMNLEFEKEVGSNQQKKDVESFLQTQLKKVQVALGAHAGLQWSTEERMSLEGLKCQFYGDIELEEIPTTYFEAIEFFKHLPARLKERKGVAVEITLYPLKLLIPNHAVLVQQLSEVYYIDVEKLLRKYVDLESQSVELIRFAGNIVEAPKADNRICFKGIQEKLGEFRDLLREHFSILKGKFRKLVPQIKSGHKNEEDFDKAIKKTTTSYFKPEGLEKWLEGKKRELNSLKKYMTIMNDIGFVIREDFDAALKDSEKDFSFVFVFSSLGREEIFLKRLKEARDLQMKLSNVQEPEIRENGHFWFDDPSTLSRVEALANFYADFAKKNKNNKHVTFFITPKDVAEYEGAVIELYKKEELVERLGSPVTMEPPEVTRDPKGTIVQWETCRFFTDFIENYRICYKRSGREEEGLPLPLVPATSFSITVPNSFMSNWTGIPVYQVSPVFQFGEGPPSNFNVSPRQQGADDGVRHLPGECRIMTTDDLSRFKAS